MKQNLGKDILINNGIFILLQIVIIFVVFVNSNGVYGGMIEGIYTELILISLFFVYLLYKIRKIKELGIKLIYSYSSSVILILLTLIIFMFETPMLVVSVLILPLIVSLLSIFISKFTHT